MKNCSPMTIPDPLTGLTRRQAELVRKLVAYFREHQRWPSLREMSLLMGCQGGHPSSMLFNLQRLQAKGVLNWQLGKGARSIHLAGLTWEPRFADTPAGERLKQILEEP